MQNADKISISQSKLDDFQEAYYYSLRIRLFTEIIKKMDPGFISIDHYNIATDILREDSEKLYELISNYKSF